MDKNYTIEELTDLLPKRPILAAIKMHPSDLVRFMATLSKKEFSSTDFLMGGIRVISDPEQEIGKAKPIYFEDNPIVAEGQLKPLAPEEYAIIDTENIAKDEE